MMERIARAVIPAAGFGTRLRPITEAIPKEMLPIGRKPVLEHVLDELRDAGISQALLVISLGKEMIRSYFEGGERVGIEIDYAIQEQMIGLGDAILRAEEWADGEPVLVAFGDTLIRSTAVPNPVARLIQAHIANKAWATVLAQRIDVANSRKYGILAPRESMAKPSLDPFVLKDIVEKPDPASAPSDLAVGARWAFEPGIFAALRGEIPGADGEIGLTECVQRELLSGRSVWGVPLLAGEERLDIGGWKTYLHASVRAAMADPEY